MQRVITQTGELREKENYKMKPSYLVWTMGWVVLLFTKLEQGGTRHTHWGFCLRDAHLDRQKLKCEVWAGDLDSNEVMERMTPLTDRKSRKRNQGIWTSTGRACWKSGRNWRGQRKGKKSEVRSHRSKMKEYVEDNRRAHNVKCYKDNAQEVVRDPRESSFSEKVG